MKYVLFLLVLSCTPLFSFAANEDTPEIDSRYLYLYSDYKVNADATHTEEHKWAIKILKERAVNNAKQTTISYSTSIQKAEVISAYTLKPDGRRIEAPKTNYQVQTNSGKDKNAPVFSDRTKLTVVFPDVQVGDTVAIDYKIIQTEAMFPGQFTASGSYSYNYPYDDVRVTLDLPDSLQGRYQARDMKQHVVNKDGRKIVTLTFANKIPEKNDRRNYSVWDIESVPGFIYSTFSSYRQIAETYGERAIPKAKPTERVSELAKKIVADAKGKKQQAQLLYEWVATQISYAGNCIGVGAVVPHDLSFILDNRMGDCKDHATLLQALLAARGIKSTQALINAGTVYKLPSLPMVSAVNHVINYLPEFDMFVDSTSSSTPFGMLPTSDIDKPVLLVEGYRKGMKTPVPPRDENAQYMKTTVRIKKDGSISGDISVQQKGRMAVYMRAGLRHVTKDQEEKFIKAVYQNERHTGSGSWVRDDPKPLLDRYSYKVKFNENDFISLPGAGAFHVSPLFPSQGSVSDFIYSDAQQPEKVDVACSNGISEEEYAYTLPKGISILAKPGNVDIKSKYLDYSASYVLKNNVLMVKRKVVDKSPGASVRLKW